MTPAFSKPSGLRSKNVTIGFSRSSESSGNSCGDQDEQVLVDLTDLNHQENLIVLMRSYGIGDNLSHVHLLLGKDVIVKSEERREPDAAGISSEP